MEQRSESDGQLHALLPRSDLWGKPFVQWSDDDWRWGGYSAQWDLRSGEMLWAVGAIPRGEMTSHGKDWEEFVKSEELKSYREHYPRLFSL